MSKPRTQHDISIEAILKAYRILIYKMASNSGLEATECSVGFVMPVGCKKGLQIFIRAARIKQ